MTTKPRIHTPLLVDAVAHRCQSQSLHVEQKARLHDYLKVIVWHPVLPEPIWLELCLRSSSHWIGQVRSTMAMRDDPASAG
jgi:hypothetical protein